MAILSSKPQQSPIIHAAPAADNSGLDDGTLWTQYLNALTGVAGQGNVAGLMATSAVTSFDIGDSNQQNVNQAIHQVADRLPQWQMIYAPSEVSLFSQYGLFLNGLQLVPTNTSPALQKQLKNDDDSLRANVRQLQKDIDAGMPPAIISTDQQSVDASVQAVSEDLEKINGPNFTVIGQDLSNYGSAQAGTTPGSTGNQLTMPTPSQTSTPIQVPLYQTSNYSQWLVTAAANAASQPPKFQQTFSFNESSNSTYSGSFTTSNSQSESSFFGWYSQSQSSWQSFASQGGEQVSYSLTVELPGVIVLDVQPGGWFDGTLIKDFQNGPFQEKSPFHSGQIFGDGGLLDLMVSQVLVGYMPTISVSFDETSWNTFYSQWTASDCSALAVGPFYANSSSSSTQGNSATASYDATNTTVTFTYNTPVPVLLAVIADVLP